MARIPQFSASRQLDTGSVVQYPSGSPVGAAISNLGGALQGVAERFKAIQDKKDAFDTTLRENEMSAAISAMEQDAVKNAPADGSGIHDGVYGQIDPATNTAVKPGSFDALFDSYLERVPESKRGEFAAMRETYRLRGSNRLAAAQYGAQQDYYKVEIQKTENNIVNSIMQMDPNDAATFDAYKKNGLDIIEKSGLPALERDVAKANWEAKAEIALGENMIANDPQGALKLREMLGFRNETAGGSSVDGAAALLRKFEGFRTSTYWDVNAHRVGYGSDTITRADGSVVRVQQGDTVTREDAERDLARRAADFERTAAAKVGAGWNNLPGNVKAALTSITYNYGRLPANVAAAAQTGDAESIAKAVEALKWHNNGVNAGRRQEEANIIRGAAGMPKVDPRFANMTADQRQQLANKALAAINQRKAEDRAIIDVAATNAPAAIMSTGNYNEPLPTLESFMSAYGPREGADRYNNFQASVQTAQQAYAMQTMPAEEIKNLVAEFTPSTSGNDAALAQSRYEALSKAAAATLKAREADPATYVRQAFPAVKNAWSTPNQPGGFQAAIAASVAAQKQLGIANIRPLPNELTDTIVGEFKDENRPEAERINAVAGVLMSTPDPTQQRAIFEQMVDAGLPDMTEGAFVALSRGDTGAANRLFRAALVDPAKLPGKAPETPAAIDEQIQSTLMDENQIGDLYYGLSDGSAENLVRAQRDSKLLNNAVNLRLRNGEELSAAVSGAAKDLYGDVKPVTGDRAQVIIPADEDARPYFDGFEGLMPQVEEAINSIMVMPPDLAETDGTKAIMSAVKTYGVQAILSEGHFRNYGDGFVFLEPFDGTAIVGVDGNPLVFTADQVKAAVPAARTRLEPDPAPLTDDAFTNFQNRMLDQ